MEQERDATLQQIAKKALTNSVVRLDVERETPLLALRPQLNFIKITTNNGSGFFVDKHLIVTNFHVMIGATSVSIGFLDSEHTFEIESVEACDVKNDLILLKVAYEGTPLKLGDSDSIVDEDAICAVGYPDGVDEIVHGTIDGILERQSGDWIRMKIKVAGGSSGGPIINSEGEVIGIHALRGIDASGNNWGSAIPSNTLKSLIKEAGETMPFASWQKLPQIRALAETKTADEMRKDSEYKEAIAHYDIAIELEPDMVEAYEGRADAKMEIGAFDGAVADLFAVHRRNSVAFSFSNFRAYFSWQWKRVLILGLSVLTKFLKAFFGERGWLVAQGNSKAREAKTEVDQGNTAKARRLYQEAIHYFTEAIHLDLKVGITYNNRGWTQYLMGQLEVKDGNTTEAEKLYQEAINDADAGLRLKPKLARFRAATYHTRGVAKAGLSDYNGAIEDFDESIQLNPKKALYYYDRAGAKKALNQHEAAKVDFQKAKETDPDIGK